MSLKPGIYKHYKTGKLYRVIGAGKHSETLEDLVFYEAQYDNPVSKLWARPLAMFVESVNTPEGSKPRFSFVSEE